MSDSQAVIDTECGSIMIDICDPFAMKRRMDESAAAESEPKPTTSGDVSSDSATGLITSCRVCH